MGGSGRSTRAEQRELVSAWRADGRTYAGIAQAIRHRYGVNARVALRLAHGWSQSDAATEWNRRWPESPKTFKNFSYWEQWPGRTGYAPSLSVLDRLAQLYQCSLADLLADGADYRDLDEHHGRPPRAETPFPVEAADPIRLDLTGTWHSRYAYISSSRAGRMRAEEHYVVLSQESDKLTVTSLPHPVGSRLLMELSVDGPIVTGTWIERTSPSEGDGPGASSHGVVQLVADPSGQLFEGRWLGFDSALHIRTGPWTLRSIDGAVDDAPEG